MSWILKDWADNRLTDLEGNQIDFDSFESGWNYILESYPEKEHEELFIVEEK